MSKRKVIVIGNEKGGVGKTTFSMHLIVGLLYYGYSVASIDVDSYQKSLTRYVKNRELYNQRNATKVPVPLHHAIDYKNNEEENLSKIINDTANVDYLVIDTPGSHTEAACLAHTYANIVITPINDSLIDMDMLAEINPENYQMTSPSVYSNMVWKQKLESAARNNAVFEWVVMRNRLSSTHNVNKQIMGKILGNISKRLGFKIAPGFVERVIFKELFANGLTLLDSEHMGKSLAISHIAAKQELRDFFSFLKISQKENN